MEKDTQMKRIIAIRLTLIRPLELEFNSNVDRHKSSAESKKSKLSYFISECQSCYAMRADVIEQYAIQTCEWDVQLGLSLFVRRRYTLHCYVLPLLNSELVIWQFRKPQD